MRFEKITENKIRITFNLDDLSEKDIDFHSFMANSDETQALFLDMLEQAEKEIGFITKDYKLMIEALATSEGNFILTVTRSLPETIKTLPKKLHGKRKDINSFNTSAIYKFNDFEDFCKVCNCLDDDYIKILNKNIASSLYVLNNNYYLVLKINETDNSNVKNLYCIISEFASYKKYSKLFEHRLLEYGNLIIKNKAFSKVKKYFI